MDPASTPGDRPLLRAYIDVPVRKSATIEVDGVAVDFDGFDFYIYADGEQTTTTCFKVTPFGVPGALELHISRRHGVPGVLISLHPRVARVRAAPFQNWREVRGPDLRAPSGPYGHAPRRRKRGGAGAGR